MATFPSATVVYNDNVVSTTQTYIRNKPADVIFEHNLLLGGLWASDRMPGTPGERPSMLPNNSRKKKEFARELWIPVAFNRSTNTKAFRDAAVLPTNIDDVATKQSAIYSYYTEYAAITTTEQLENQGSSAIYSIMQSRVDQALRTLSETIEIDLWSTNTDTTAGTQESVIGIQHFFDVTPTTGTVWTIDRAVYTFQRQQHSDAAAAFATNGLAQMRSMRTAVSGTSGADKMSFIATTPAIWEAYTAEAEGIHQVTRTDRVAELGFDVAWYQGVPVAYSAQCVDGLMYFFNTNYWYLLMPPGTDFRTKSYDSPPNQMIEDQVRILMALQWGCERFDRQGAISGFTDT